MIIDNLTVSIIIPVYNVEAYVEQCLRSVMEQTWRPLECVIVDDCVTDGSMDVVRRLLDGYKGDIVFRVIGHTKNRGLSAARNTGADEATGDYVLFIDSDDWLCRADSVALLARKAAEWPGVQMVYGCACCDSDEESLNASLQSPKALPMDRMTNNSQVRDCFYGSQYNTGLSVYSWNKLLSRRFLTDSGIRFDEGVYHEDIPYMFHLVNQLEKVAVVKEDTYVYRRHPGSITTLSERKRYGSINTILTSIVSRLPADDYERQFYYYFRTFIFRYSIVPDRRLWRSTYSLYLRQSLRRGYLDLFFLLLFATITLTFGKGGRLIPELTKKMLQRHGIRNPKSR